MIRKHQNIRRTNEQVAEATEEGSYNHDVYLADWRVDWWLDDAEDCVEDWHYCEEETYLDLGQIIAFYSNC